MFWNDKNMKILGHYDLTFDENVLYKDETNMRSEDAEKVGVKVELHENSQHDAFITSKENPQTHCDRTGS